MTQTTSPPKRRATTLLALCCLPCGVPLSLPLLWKSELYFFVIWPVAFLIVSSRALYLNQDLVAEDNREGLLKRECDSFGNTIGMKGKKLTDFTHKNVTYRVGDCVLVRGAGEKLPFVGRIRDVKAAGKNGQISVQVAWFYRPEEATGGRKAFHGQKELFKSEHLDWCYASTIESKCRVHTLQNYQALARVTDADFYARFTYKPVTKEFCPDRVPVYCICELPYNPDAFMILCSKCEEWYHPKCINLTKGDCEKMVHFECPECKQASREAKRLRIDPSANGSHTGA